MRRFAEVAVRLWPHLVHVSIALLEGQSTLQFYPLVPKGPRAVMPAYPLAQREAVLLNGVAVTSTGSELRAVLDAFPSVAVPPGPRRRVVALTSLPLITAGRVVGAVHLGSSHHAAHRALDPAAARRLMQAMAPHVRETLPNPSRSQDSTKKRDVISRLLHDLRTPLSGIGLAAELMELDPPSVPGVIIEAMRTHYADLLRYMIELEDVVFLDLSPRLPAAQPCMLSDMLEVVLWRILPYTRRRRQDLLVTGNIERPLLVSQYHLEQTLTTALFDVSACATTDSVVTVQMSLCGDRATIAIIGASDPSELRIEQALVDPYLRAEPEGPTAGLMSLAAAKRALEHYGGALTVSTANAHLNVTLAVPVA